MQPAPATGRWIAAGCIGGDGLPGVIIMGYFLPTPTYALSALELRHSSSPAALTVTGGTVVTLVVAGTRSLTGNWWLECRGS